jgi:D-glucosaminate-6-phosphate ammonia-lyase
LAIENRPHETGHEIIQRLGVTPIINAGGPNTKHSGSRPRQEAMDTMQAMSEVFVNIDELLIAAGKEIAMLVGAEAATITSGASGGLVVQAAAAVSKGDPAIIARLPDTTGIPNELVIQKAHRFVYDHLYLVPGTRFVEAGDESGCTPEQLEAAISDRTAGVIHLESPFKNRGTVPVEQAAEIAHAHGLPLLVDAASMLPPRDNLRRFTAAGADLVSFSGGKAVRGPQSTGMLLGKPEWIEYARLVNAPNATIARAQKVSKEEIAGLLAALRTFINEDEQTETQRYTVQMEQVVDQLAEIPGTAISIEHNYDHYIPHAVVRFTDSWRGPDGPAMAARLMAKSPRVYVVSGYIGPREIWIDPLNIQPGELDAVIKRVHEELIRASAGN